MDFLALVSLPLAPLLFQYELAQIVPPTEGGPFNVVNVAALITAAGAAVAQLFRIWKERQESQGDQHARVQERKIEVSGTIEQINMDRTEKLFLKYEAQLRRQEEQNEALQEHVNRLQDVVTQLKTEVTKLRVENSYLRGIIEDNPEWAVKVDFTLMDDLVNNFVPDTSGQPPSNDQG